MLTIRTIRTIRTIGTIRIRTITAAAAALLITVTPGLASAGTLNLSGDWSFSATGSWKKGPCPAGGNGAGTLRIKQTGDKVTLVFTSGRVCRPASMCTFKGKLSGKKLTLGNGATVDGEGGKVTNAITLTVKDATSAAGSSSSSYKHPRMSCSWGSKVAIKKAEKKAEKKAKKK